MKRLLLLAAVLLGAASGLFAKTPVIGISAYSENGRCQVNMTYVNSVRMAGGVPLVIPLTEDDDQIEAIIDAIDGLVMTGGEDFDPLKWFGEEPIRGLGEVVPERDAYDVKLVRAAVAKGIHVLGICRGEQLLGIAFGGSLWQDIPSQVKDSYVKHRQGPTNGAFGTHSIQIEKGSLLSTILGGRTTAVVNSFHHQAIKKVPQGLKVVATAADGIIEAVERSGRLAPDFADGGGMILGVQFHPEVITNAGNPEFLPIFQKLVKEAAN
jgi:putative glutamine amidotransferase